MIAVSLDRVGLPLIAVAAIASGAGGFTMPKPELPVELAPVAAPPAKVAATIDVSHLMAPVDLLSLVRVVEVPAAAATEASAAASVPVVSGAEGPAAATEAVQRTEAARSRVAKPMTAVAPPVVEFAPAPVRRHPGSTTVATGVRKLKQPDPAVQAVAAFNPALPRQLASPVTIASDRILPDAAKPTDTDLKVASRVERTNEGDLVPPAIDLGEVLPETRTSAVPAPLPPEEAGAPLTLAGVAQVASHGAIERDVALPAPSPTVSAATLSAAQPSVSPAAPEPRAIDVRAVSLDMAVIAPAAPVILPVPRQASSAAPTDLAAAAPADVRAVIVPVVATTAALPAAIPTADVVATPPPPAAPSPRRDPATAQSPIALRERADSPVSTAAAPPPPPPPNYAADPPRPTLPAAPTPPRPADFAIETPSLGAVGAEVTRRDHPAGDALHVHFAVDRSGTAALIAGASDGLERAVVATGNRLDAVTIEVRGGMASAAGSGSDGASGVGHREGDAPQHRPATPPQPETPSMRVRAPVIKPVVRDRFA